MDKLIGYAALVFRLAFLPLRKHILTKKRKIALLLTSNIIMMYAVFTISIHQKSIFTQVNEAYAAEQTKLDNEERKIHEIILKHAKTLLHPNMITIVPTRTLEA